MSLVALADSDGWLLAPAADSALGVARLPPPLRAAHAWALSQVSPAGGWVLACAATGRWLCADAAAGGTRLLLAPAGDPPAGLSPLWLPSGADADCALWAAATAFPPAARGRLCLVAPAADGAALVPAAARRGLTLLRLPPAGLIPPPGAPWGMAWRSSRPPHSPSCTALGGRRLCRCTPGTR